MTFKTGDKVVHTIHGVGTIQVMGVNGLCRVAFDNGSIAVIKTIELSKYYGAKEENVKC
jgi:hypothetical protein